MSRLWLKSTYTLREGISTDTHPPTFGEESRKGGQREKGGRGEEEETLRHTPTFPRRRGEGRGGGKEERNRKGTRGREEKKRRRGKRGKEEDERERRRGQGGVE